MNSPIKRYQRNAKKRIATKLERLASAFLQETGIKAEDACLRQTTSPEGVISVWFDKKTSVANLHECHQDVEHCFSLLWKFHNDFGNFSMGEYREAVAELMSKYEQYFNAGKDVEATQDAQEAKSLDQLEPSSAGRQEP